MRPLVPRLSFLDNAEKAWSSGTCGVMGNHDIMMPHESWEQAMQIQSTEVKGSRSSCICLCACSNISFAPFNSLSLSVRTNLPSPSSLWPSSDAQPCSSSFLWSYLPKVGAVIKQKQSLQQCLMFLLWEEETQYLWWEHCVAEPSQIETSPRQS